MTNNTRVFQPEDYDPSVSSKHVSCLAVITDIVELGTGPVLGTLCIGGKREEVMLQGGECNGYSYVRCNGRIKVYRDGKVFCQYVDHADREEMIETMDQGNSFMQQAASYLAGVVAEKVLEALENNDYWPEVDMHRRYALPGVSSYVWAQMHQNKLFSQELIREALEDLTGYTCSVELGSESIIVNFDGEDCNQMAKKAEKS